MLFRSGQLGTWAAMADSEPALLLLGKMLVLHVALPAAISWLCAAAMRRRGWIQPGDLKLSM